ncbi:MAG: ParA family protein [Anaerolineae bacterium]|jgi:chromosome partitioning protein|nr:ParA family protein [Anaerolineae bacterium]
MSRVIGVLNYKGGTGKTTTVVNLATGLALHGEHVLCVDLDAQGSLATHLGVDYTYSLSQLLLGQVRPQACVVQARNNLDLIASDRSLLRAEGKLWRIGDEQVIRRTLRNKMRSLDNEYDYIVLDFSPSVSLLSESGLLYIRELIVPVSASYLGLVGLRQVIETLKTFRQMSESHVQLYLIVPTFYSDRVQQDREIIAILKRYFAGKVTGPIRSSVKISESPSHRMSIYEYSPRSTGAVDYARLVERVLRDG